MSQDPQQIADEIAETRDDLARKVDALIDRAKIEAGEVGRKLAIGVAAIAGLLIVGLIAKRRLR